MDTKVIILLLVHQLCRK